MVLVMQSDKRGVKIDPTLGLQGLNEARTNKLCEVRCNFMLLNISLLKLSNAHANIKFIYFKHECK